MPGFFSPNIDRKGRILRLIWGLLCVIGGLATGFAADWITGTALLGAGVFSLFEALRGWCILRACGIKTKH
jgi:hypothetical protein